MTTHLNTPEEAPSSVPTHGGPRWIRPPDVDPGTWARLKQVTRWMLVRKYGLEQERAS